MLHMKGHCILSHGFESGPDATKVTALALAAEACGWTHERPDYTHFDADRDKGPLGDVPNRLAHLIQIATRAAEKGPVVLAGSSLGAWVSGHASVQVPVVGLYLMAPPIHLSTDHPIIAADIPTAIIHGWHDELIPAADVIEWARARNDALLLVNDSHRLSDHVTTTRIQFQHFLEQL
jgi:predicted alpha/beta-hydrolase family hydrolase